MSWPLSSRERVLTAFRHQEPDRVPVFDQLFSPAIYQAVLGYVPDTYDSVAAARCAAGLGMDAAFALYAGYPGIQPPGRPASWQSEWGTTYGSMAGAWSVGAPTAHHVQTRPDLDRFIPPDPHLPRRMEPIQQAREACDREGLALIGAVRGPFALLAYHWAGLVTTLTAIYDDPAFLASAFRIIADFDIAVCDQMIAAGVDIIWITEDIAGTEGPLLSPVHYRMHVLPYLRELVTFARSRGRPVVFHSDGYLMPFIDDLLDTGIAGLDPIERAAGMDLAALKRQVGARVCLLGNVDNKSTLGAGTPEQVEQEVRECIGAAGRGGGYVVISDNSLHAGVPYPNARAMVDAAHRWGRYPLDPMGAAECSTSEGGRDGNSTQG
jgi:uroporphyrinogen decarboxylase